MVDYKATIALRAEGQREWGEERAGRDLLNGRRR